MSGQPVYITAFTWQEKFLKINLLTNNHHMNTVGGYFSMVEAFILSQNLQ